MDCSLPGSSVHWILQARILDWVAFPFSRGLPAPGIEPRSPALQEDSLPPAPPENTLHINYTSIKKKKRGALAFVTDAVSKML